MCGAGSEWYSWHFPELVKIVNDNHLFARLVGSIGAKSSLTDETTAKTSWLARGDHRRPDCRTSDHGRRSFIHGYVFRSFRCVSHYFVCVCVRVQAWICRVDMANSEHFARVWSAWAISARSCRSTSASACTTSHQTSRSSSATCTFTQLSLLLTLSCFVIPRVAAYRQ